MALPSIAELTAQREAAASDPDLDEATRVLLDQHYAKALEHLQAIEQATAQTSALKQELDGAAQRVADLQQRLAAPPPTDEAESQGASASASELLAACKVAEETLSAATQRLTTIGAEVDRRAARRPQLADLRTQTMQQATEVAAQLASPAPEGERPVVAAIRLIRFHARRQRLERELALLDQEARTYEGTTRLWSLQRDIAQREAREAERQLQRWQRQLGEAQRREAEWEAQEARRTADRAAEARPQIRKAAELNTTLAEENSALVKTLEQTQADWNDIRASQKQYTAEFDDLKRRAETAKFSQAIGVLLRSQQAALPDSRLLRRKTKLRQIEITALSLKLIEWEGQRRALLDQEEAVRNATEGLQEMRDAIERGDIEEQIRGLLAARLKLLGDLIENGNTQLDRLVRLDGEEQSLAAAIEEQARWLAEHVLWVRSAGPLGTQPRSLLAACRELCTADAWAPTWRLLAAEARTPGVTLAGLALVGLVIARSPLRRRIRELGQLAHRSNNVEFLPTIRVCLLTALVAAPLPAALLLLGWRLAIAGADDPFAQSLGLSMQLVAACWMVIESIRHVALPEGLGEAHFGWPPRAMSAVRGATRWLMFGLLPPMLVVAHFEWLEDEQQIGSVGRLAYLVAMGCLVATLYRMLRASGPVVQALLAHDDDSLLSRSRGIWTWTLILFPLALLGMSVLGYHYTAVQLTGRLAATLGAVLAMVFTRALLSRWLLVVYRRLAIRRARERRSQALASGDQDAAQLVEPARELRLADINTQARRLVHVMAGVITVAAVYWIWLDVLPALGALGKVSLWQSPWGLTAEGTPEWVTAADVAVALIIASLTMFGVRNIPGLVEMLVLQRLPLDAGARYAASAVARHLIVVVGVVAGFRTLGIGWASVQWLVAAMTFGLGFGLQEIFANFVSGIILLFERPIRVGDTVTVGEISGTVTRIRSRATTILDWDNRELIVPNRQFVTGNVVNWTLTNPTLRLTISVGVAYGSDTRMTSELLLQAAAAHADVLSDPEPVVVFREFGESSLNFELRLFVNGLTAYRRVQHELHLAIDDLFREHEIELAFPQRDLHVRSLPQELIAGLRAQGTFGRRGRGRDEDEDETESLGFDAA